MVTTVRLTFPTVLPSGETPDQRLPDGTTMRTRVIAANAAGTDVMTSNRITPIASIGPNATMHGLRFDRNRKAYLQTSNSYGATQQFTVSAWVKVTGDSSNKSIYTSGTNSAVSGYFRIYMNGSNEIVLETTNSSVYTEYNTSGASSIIGSVQWFHLVVSVDTTQAALADQFKVYVNGTYFADTNSANAAPQNASILQSPMGVGVMYFVDGSDNNWMDGYFSDVYYVDGQALEPETFGKFFEGKWGPLNSSVVKSNIETAKSEAFPDDQYNRDYVWSSSVTTDAALNSSYPLNQMFDGDEVTFASTSPTNSGGVVDFGNKFPAGSSYDVEVFKVSETSGLTINGAGPSRVGAEAAYNYWDGVASIPDITWDNAGSFGARYIKVNGRILVDAGFGPSGFHLPFDPAAPSAKYSTSLTFAADASGTPGDAVPDAIKGFDGSLITYIYHSSIEGLVWTPTGLNLSGDLESICLILVLMFMSTAM